MLICFCGTRMNPDVPEDVWEHRTCVFAKLPEVEGARQTLLQMARILRCQPEQVHERIISLREKVRRWERELAELSRG